MSFKVGKIGFVPVQKLPLRVLTTLFMATPLFLALIYSYAAMSPRQELEQLEEIAKIRSQAAKTHELRAEGKKEQAFSTRSVSGSSAVGELFDVAGDEKFSASDEYQKASNKWEKAAKSYKAMGEADKAEVAAENAALTWDAAKRTLREGAELYRMAEVQFENVRDLEKQVNTLKKLARNIEKLMEMNK